MVEEPREPNEKGWSVTRSVWIVVLVITTDVAGYFAGKTFGGP